MTTQPPINSPTEEPAGPPTGGRRIGNIRLGERLGQGGMGAVFLGYDEKLQRQVAIKAIRSDRLDNHTRQRFLAEARILSLLDHPNVCRIYDYLEDAGEGFLVLEWIRGRDLAATIRGNALPFSRRLEIAEKVATALTAAHAKGIVHRDLKPANVMLTTQGDVKVLDFGLARPAAEMPGDVEPSQKLPGPVSGDSNIPSDSNIPGDRPHETAQPSAEAVETYWLPSIDSSHTEHGHLMGTPAQMSPEQARGEPATAASDLYSFGLLLQELVTGQPPYPLDLDRDLLLVKVGQGDTRRVASSDAEVTTLITELLALAPEARPTAATAQARLRRIRQRPARRRRQLLAALLALVALGGGLKYTSDLRRERNEAVAARAGTEATVNFLVETFGAADPWDQTREQNLRDVLDRGAERVRDELHRQPSVRVKLLLTLGKVYLGLGQAEPANSLLEEAHQLQLEISPEDSPEVATTLVALAQVRTFEDSEKLYLRGLEILEAAPAAEPQVLGRALHGLAALYRYQGDYAQARPLFERALSFKESELYADPDDLSLAMTLFTFAELLLDQGELERAETLLERCLTIRRRGLAEGSPRIALTLKTLGRLEYLRGDLEEARQLWRQALSQFETHLGMEHPEATAILNDLALVHMGLGEPDAAIPLYQQAIEAYRRVQGPRHRDTAIALNNLAGVLRFTGQFSKAGEHYNEALDILRETLGEGNVLSGIVLFRLAELERSRQRFDAAESAAQQSLAILDPALGPTHARVTALHLLLGDLAFRRGDIDAAGQLFRQSLEASRERFAADDSRVNEFTLQAAAHLGLAKAVATRGDDGAAVRHRDDALQLLEPLAATSQDVELRHAYALTLLHLGHAEEARPVVAGLVAFGWSDPELLALAALHGLIPPR